MEPASAPGGPPPPIPPPPAGAGPAPFNSFAAPTPSPASQPNEVSFRILCPSSKTANVPLDLPGAKIRVLDEPAPTSCDDRIIVVCSHAAPPAETREETGIDSSSRGGGGQWLLSSAQQALLRVFESIVSSNDEADVNADRPVVCRLLAGNNQTGREGRLLERIRQESSVSIRLVPRDQFPANASFTDELIEITGELSAVKQAILSVTTFLHENPGAGPVNFSSSAYAGEYHGSSDMLPPHEQHFPHRGHPSGRYHADYHKRSYSHGPGRMAGEEEVIFKLLCQQSKVGSLIGKGGSVIRAIENDTGAYVKIGDMFPDSDERVVVISARENSEHKGSPAQDAVMRVHHRIAEIGFDPHIPVVARLLAPSPQIRFLLGKGGSIINEIRRGTGANIRIAPKDQSSRYGVNIDEVVQVMGNLQIVDDALFHITSRFREYMVPWKPHPSGFSGPPPPPHIRPRHNPHSPGSYPPPSGPIPHAIDGPVPPGPVDHQPPFPRPPGGNFGGDMPSYGPPPFDRPPSPRMWGPQQQPYGGSNPIGPRSGPHGSGNQGPMLPGAPVEVIVPQALIGHVHGENDCNLIDIRQISGAKVDIYGPKPGTTEGVVVVGGTPDQVRAAQSLIHAFILCGQAF